MNQRTFMIFCSVIVSLFLLAATVERVSAQLQKLNLQELTNQAEVVAVGKVSAMRSEWNQDKTRIYTKVTVSVGQYIKGERSEKTLTITHLGGEVGGVGELYTHTPRFFMDEEVLVFAKKDKQENLRITGGADGKLKIAKNEQTGKKMIGKTKTLEAFTTEIESIVRKQKER